LIVTPPLVIFFMLKPTCANHCITINRSQSLPSQRVALRWHRHHNGLKMQHTVGIVSSWNEPVVSTFTSEDFPAFCSPISVSSISRLKNRLHMRVSGCGTR
jgi:hypothetical protein